MFIIYHSNNLEVQKDILLDRMNSTPLSDPFQREIILVQSPGMAQWLQLKIAEKQGIAANLGCPMPASFIWQQYADNLPNVAQQSEFHKDAMTWRLMNLIKQADFRPLLQYFHQAEDEAQQKLYQLARKIADLFDQYLVYRPDWIMAWETGDDAYIERQIQTQQKNALMQEQIAQDIKWQGDLWRALVAEIRTVAENKTGIKNEVQHRAHLHLQYLQKLTKEAPKNLPPRLFIFGISALPKVYLETFQAISRYCDVHLFFNNPSQYYWGDIVSPAYLQNLKIKHRTLYGQERRLPLFSDEQLNNLTQDRIERTAENEQLQIGNPLLATWGKLGRDFFYLLGQTDAQEIQAYVESAQPTLLAQVQNRILNLVPTGKQPLNIEKNDRTLSIHSCHSAMREVEVLHDYLLHLFQQDNTLTPKDIVVMVANIDQYAPYIQAVFRQYEDNRHIPFSIADGKLSESDVLLSAFLSLLQLKENRFNAEDVLALLDIPAVRARFKIELSELENIRYWVAESGIRFGLDKYLDGQQTNYNSWQAGLERMLLGYALREENGIWQDSLGFDNSYGLKGRLAGALAQFIACLRDWHQILQQACPMAEWQQHLLDLIDNFFQVDEQSAETLLYIKNTVQELAQQLADIPFEQSLTAEVIAEVMAEKLNENDTSMKFLVGKVSFCTLLPMRSIPFRVVCLLGMNDGDYPRRQTGNSLDLMQYHRQKGDRSRHDDDRYLFLEALLAAQDYFYISYVGRSIIDNSVKEPSVLVNQLLDYLRDNALQPDAVNNLIEQYAITIFSPENFSKTHRSFAKEWLPLAQNSRQAVEDFVQPMEQAETENEIEFGQLLAFVTNPVRFFFEKRLGVYFRNEGELIGESENFTLSGLELYKINDKLLHYNPEELQDFFARLNVKGILPRGAFAQVYEQKVRSEMTEFYETVKPYLQQTPDSETVELLLPTEQGEVLLYGNLNSLFGEQKQRVVWRVGKSKDNYVIENWLYYLFQAATCENVVAPIFYNKEDGVNAQTFKTIEKTTALSQLQIYVEAYLEGIRLIQLVPTVRIENWLKTDEPDLLRKELNKLIESNQFTSGDIYWQRILQQTSQVDLLAMKAKMQAWFGLMIDQLVKVGSAK